MFKYFTTTLITIVFFFSNAVLGQIVTDSISFNYYSSAILNDFTDHFIGGTGLIQKQDSGITGGCLRTPTTISWGNDNAIYCSRLKSVPMDFCEISVCFLYDTTTLNNINFDRTASLWFNPSADWNHYFIAECNPNGIRTITYYSATNGTGYTPIHNHWYLLKAGIVFTAATPGYSASLIDLGITGHDNIAADQISFSETDSILGLDQSITVSLTGTSYGGAKFLDNFSFYGDTSYSNCLNTAVLPISDQFAQVRITNSAVSIESIDSPFSVDLYNLNGQLIFTKDRLYHFERDIKNLSKGIYVLKVCMNGGIKSYKLVATN